MICPCKECKDRRLACHGHCERFREWRKPIEKYKKEREKLNQVDSVMHDGLRRWKRGVANGVNV